MKRKTRPEQILKNLKQMIEDAEEALAQSRSGEMPEEQLSELKERVQEGFTWLREHSNDVGGQVKGYYNDMESRMKDYYSDAEERLRDYYEEIEERMRAGVETTDRTLRNHPYQMASVTFGLGVALGAAISMMSKSR